MARLREGELLTSPVRKPPVLRRTLVPGGALVVLLLGLAVGKGVPAAPDPDAPVFFRDPDPGTARVIDRAIEYLRRPGFADHATGRAVLTEIGYWSVRPLLRLLADGTNPERRNAALVLGQILDRRGWPGLVEASREKTHQYLATFSALMIGRFRRPEGLDALRRLIEDESMDPRRVAAVLAVAKTGGPRAFDILRRRALVRKPALIREAAVFCLGFFREQALVRAPGGNRVPCPALRAALASSSSDLRRAAMLALALLADRDLKPVYLRFASPDNGADPKVRRIALLALGRFSDPDVTRLLLDTLRRRRVPAAVKITAAYLLKDRHDPASLDALVSAAPEDQQLRAALTMALSDFEDRRAVLRLVQRLSDRSDQVASAAAFCLSRLTTPEYRELARRALDRWLKGAYGAIDETVRHNMRCARDLLLGRTPPGSFLWVGNEQFVKDLPKDVEERILDLANRAAERVLGVSALTDIRAGPVSKGRFRVDDRNSELRDLKTYLEVHPYFVPADIPEPRVAITPRPRPPEKDAGKPEAGR